MFGHQFNFSSQQLRQMFSQRQTLAEKVITAGKIDQKIHITIRSFLAARDRAKCPDATSSIAISKRDNGAFMCVYFVQ